MEDWRQYWEFYEIEARLRRANEHLSDLKRKIDRLLKPYINETVDHPEFDGLCKPGDVVYVDSTSWVRDTIGLRILADECLHNLRSALNYLVLTLIEHDSPPIKGRNGGYYLPPIPRRISFPIESSPKRFAGHRSALFKGVSNEHVAMIERLRPYNGCHWIERLRDLTNGSKHRCLIDVSLCIQHVAGEPLEDETEGTKGNPMYVYWVEPDVLFDDGSPVIETLEKPHLHVSQVIEIFKTTMR